MGQGQHKQNYLVVKDKVSEVIIPRPIKKRTMVEAIRVMLEIAACIGLPSVVCSNSKLV